MYSNPLFNEMYDYYKTQGEDEILPKYYREFYGIDEDGQPVYIYHYVDEEEEY